MENIYKENKEWLTKMHTLISLLKKIISSDAVYQDKYSNLKNISYQNKWDDINKKLIKLINEN